ncbi:50S ribosomal protein L20 [Patescibacteria group bacterium]|nr:50S ribosomal protein L20 [Patescibacteria group bacterium]MBU4512938.1 50S ribosomal protein L20 [Patescibacteria group bacterium]
MPRVKRGTTHIKKRRKLLKQAKGYKWGRKNLIKQAKTAVIKAGVHAYHDRRTKKRTARALWNIKINAAVREHGLSYSAFINALRKKNVELDRKVLADLAENEPGVFGKIIDTIK